MNDKLMMAINAAQAENRKCSALYDAADRAWHQGLMIKAAELRAQAGAQYEIAMRAWEAVERVRFGITK